MSFESLPVKHRDRKSRKNSKILHGKIFKHAEKNRVKHGKLARKKKTKSRLSEREAKEQAMARFISESNDNEDESKNNKENSDPNQATRKEDHQLDSSDAVSQLNDKIANIKATLNDDTMNNKRKMTNICQKYLSIQQILLNIHQSQSETKKQLNAVKVCHKNTPISVQN